MSGARCETVKLLWAIRLVFFFKNLRVHLGFLPSEGVGNVKLYAQTLCSTARAQPPDGPVEDSQTLFGCNCGVTTITKRKTKTSSL